MASARPVNCLLVCGARPNFMKIASLVDAFDATGRVRRYLVHTGQHYDEKMSKLFFGELGLPTPDVNLSCSEGGHAKQTADIMQRFEPVLIDRRPDWVIVVGDVNSTIACALVASKLGIRIAHVEAGLRSFDRSMPEEINRVLTDRLSDLYFVTEPAGMENLAREGAAMDRCHLVGDTMADTLLKHLPRAKKSQILEQMGLVAGGYAVLTLHRPGNVDDAGTLSEILDGLSAVAEEMPVVFPVHPRTKQRIESFGLAGKLAAMPNVRLAEPMGYLDFLKLMAEARLVLTDSGGVQEETTILGVACMTLRETTERPYTLTSGTNHLVKPTADRIRVAYASIRNEAPRAHPRSELTDGRAGHRIAEILLRQTS